MSILSIKLGGKSEYGRTQGNTMNVCPFWEICYRMNFNQNTPGKILQEDWERAFYILNCRGKTKTRPWSWSEEQYYMFWQSGKNATKNWKERREKKEESKIRSLIVNRGGSQRLPFQTASKRLSKIKGTIRIKIQTFPNTKKCLKRQREHRKIQKI